MNKRDLFSREVLDDLVDSSAMRKYRNIMMMNTGIYAGLDATCMMIAAEHASNGNYAGALTFTVFGVALSIAGIRDARKAYVAHTTPFEDIKPPTIKIDYVRNPIPE